MSEDRTLVVLRHGRTAWNDSGRAQGHTDVPLDGVGLAQARAAAQALAGLHPVRLWSSDLARARETAAALERCTGLEATLSDAFREYDVGERAGLTLAEFAQRFPEEHAAWLAGQDDVRTRVAGAETHAEVAGRIVPAMRDCLTQLAPGQTGILVGHGASLRVGITALLGWPAELRNTLRGMDNCGWLRLVQDPRTGALGLASYNETAEVARVAAGAGADFASDGASG